jgi:chorismate mutase / prephenate dehydrogenase
MSARGPGLTARRREIARVDRTIAVGVARRLRLARDVAQMKATVGLPLRDYAVEAEVIRRWVSRLRSEGVEPAHAESLARWLIEESIRAQEPIRHPPRPRRRNALEIAIVGGAGAMGQWLCEFLEGAGHRTSVVDPRARRGGPRIFASVAAATHAADVVVFATPIGATAPLLREALATGSDALMFDVLSVKSPIAKILARSARSGRNVTSVHPMFGPSARTLSGRNLLVVQCGNRSADRAARALFRESALSVSEVPIAAHDRLMAESLGLSHAVNLLFLGALAQGRLSARELSRIASTTFHRQASLAGSVAREGDALYLEIQAANPHSPEIYAVLEDRLRELRRIVGRRDIPRFRRWLGEGRALLPVSPAPMRA